VPTTDSTASARWRTVDIVTCAVIAVAFGVVFWAWGFVWAATEAPFAFYPPLRAIVYGVWLIPAVLAPLIVRRPGAALFTEGIAATVSVFLGSFWGMILIYQGLIQAAGGELAFASGRYRRFGTAHAVAAGALATFAATLFDAFAWYGDTDWLTFRLPYIAIATVSGAIVAGLGSVALVKAMLPTGVLDRFPAGRDRARV
jgi:energy-coupling factor transport system permease protein